MACAEPSMLWAQIRHTPMCECIILKVIYSTIQIRFLTHRMAPEMRTNVAHFIPLMFVRNTDTSFPNVSHWSLETWYENESKREEYPLRIFNSGRRNSLYASLTLIGHQYDSRCSGTRHEFKVILTQTGEVLNMSRNVIRVPLTVDTIISVKPKLTITSVGLRHYPPDQRQCFYQSKR